MRRSLVPLDSADYVPDPQSECFPIGGSMSFLRRFFVPEGVSSPAPTTPGSVAEVEMVRGIIARLDKMPPDRARFVACAAYVVARAASADAHVSEAASH